jgi:hypothetical protein
MLCDASGGEPVRPISVPDFGRSHSIVLVNLRTPGLFMTQ